MKLPSIILAGAVIAAGAPLFAGAAAAAPLSESLALKNATATSVEAVQFRRRGGRNWIGPAAGIAAGLAIAGAVASQPYYYDPGYESYAYSPGYVYSAPRPYRYRSYPGYSDPRYGDSEWNSAFPSWQR